MELARFLGVSRGAVLGWEAGSSYPKAESLKRLIALGVHQQAFVTERKEEEIRALWQAVHQKVLLDELWLSSLLGQRPPQRASLAPRQGEGTSANALPGARSAPGRRMDWDDALAVPNFYGRRTELATLEQWVVQERCRVVSVLGMGGIGKSAFVVTLMHQVAEHFEVVLFRPLRDAPSCEVLLADCLQLLSPQLLASVSASLQGRLSLLLESLRGRRALLVLDNLEALFQEGESGGHYRPGFEGYGQVLRRVGETAHQSCLLLTSREKPADLVLLEGTHSQVRALRLTGLDAVACEQLLTEKEVVGSREERRRFIEAYAGNPLALKVVAEAIVDLFAGEIGPFLKQGTVIFGSIQKLLAEQVNRLSVLEQTVLRSLVIAREPLGFEELLALLVMPLPQGQVLAAVDNLRRRSLIELSQRPGNIKLQSVVLEYVTGLFIEEATSEIEQGRLSHLIEHGLVQAGAREDVRQTQERLIVSPILARLRRTYPGRAEVEGNLLALLAQQRERSEYAQGYGPANLLSLLHQQRGHLRGLDMSHLSLRGRTCKGSRCRMPPWLGPSCVTPSLAKPLMPPGRSPSVKTGSTGQAGGRRGEVRVWREAGQTLHLLWQAHTDTVSALAFDPDGSRLASGSWDGTITLWELEGGTPLWTVWQTNSVQSLAFTPDGRMLASSSGNDMTVRLWDLHSDIPLQTLPHPAPVFSVTWSPDGRLLASGSFDRRIRLWEIQAEKPAVSVMTLSGHTNLVRELAFAPDGSRLVSGSWDRTVRLWDVDSGQCLHTLEGHTERVQTVAWSPDGRTVASAGLDTSIWLWNTERGSARAVLHGHSAPIYSIAFMPDSRGVLSDSEDGTLRVWDVARGQCVRVAQGHAVCIYDAAWSPDGSRLAGAGSDRLVIVWDLNDGTPPRVLRGHSWSVDGVGWSPDGKTLASSGWDNAIRLWDPATGSCVQVLQDAEHPDNVFRGVTWSPDGRWLASGSHLHEVQVWDMTTGTRRWVGRAHPTIIRRVAWSLDGTRLASGGDEGNIMFNVIIFILSSSAFRSKHSTAVNLFKIAVGKFISPFVLFILICIDS